MAGKPNPDLVLFLACVAGMVACWLGSVFLHWLF